MIIEDQRFPHGDMTANDRLHLSTTWGLPNPQEPRLKSFINNSGKPMVKNQRLFDVLIEAGARITDTMDVARNEGMEAFLNGAFLYAGALSVASWFNEVPSDDGVLRRVKETDAYDTVTNAQNRLVSEAYSFWNLAEEVWPVIGGDNYRLRDLSLIGAGLIHIITIESDKVCAEIASLEASLAIDDRVLEKNFRLIEAEWPSVNNE